MSFKANKKVATPVITPASPKLVDVNVGVTTINSLPDSTAKSNSFDENSSKKVDDGSSSSTAAGGPPVSPRARSQNGSDVINVIQDRSAASLPILGKAKVDDGSRSALKRGGSVASELTKLKGAVSDLNIDPVNLMALSDRYFERYDGKKSRTALRIFV